MISPVDRTKPYDLLIVGAGPVGCVIAERAAKLKGWHVLVIDKRPHIAGNCYDFYHESGLLTHAYGPHYFRTNKTELIDYLSQFTDWIEGNYFVKSMVDGRLYPFPINLTTLEMFFNVGGLTPESAELLLEKKRIPHEKPENSEEFVLSRVGIEIYEAFYLNYTIKQWDKKPSELDASVCGRVPIRMNRDERYVDHTYQRTPKDGFTAMFGKMLDSPLIDVHLETDFKAVRHVVKPRVATIYCGPLDEYFDNRLGKLPWRSLRFEFVPQEQEFVQPCVQINYPNDHAYTRTVEIKHVTQQQHPHSLVTYEYPCAEGDPYYPIPAQENRDLYTRYWALAEEETLKNNVYFSGRLAQYKYIDTDVAIEIGLNTFNRIAACQK